MTSTGKERDILLVGKTGNGKSATGNSILMKKAFKVSASSASVTKNADCEQAQFEKMIIKVVETPGVGDTECTTTEGIKLLVDAMTEAIAFSPKGFHAILIVKPYNVRFTQEEIDVINILKNIFGEGFIMNHAILCLTRGDDFVDEEEGKTPVKWCEEQAGDFLKLHEECGKRVIMFNNRTEDETIKTEQLRCLLDMIDKLTTNGMRYTNEHFQKAQEARKAILEDPAKAFLSEDTMREFGLINQQLSETDRYQPEEKVKHLRELQVKVDKLEKDIREGYKGSNALSVGLKYIHEVKYPILENLEVTETLIEKTKEIEELEMRRQREETTSREHSKEELEELLKAKKKESDELKKHLLEETERADKAYQLLRGNFHIDIARAVWDLIKSLLWKLCRFLPLKRNE